MVSLCAGALPLPRMRRLDFPARWVMARFEPLPISGGAGSLSGEGAARRVGLWPPSPRRGADLVIREAIKGGIRGRS